MPARAQLSPASASSHVVFSCVHRPSLLTPTTLSTRVKVKMRVNSLALAAASVLSLLPGLTTAAHESEHTREFFMVGGGYVNTTTGHLWSNQMYVEKLTPSCGVSQRYPIVFIHGQGQDGTVRISSFSNFGSSAALAHGGGDRQGIVRCPGAMLMEFTAELAEQT
jgi:hypothetical protein